ncbi:unnamed protein product, partial [Hapterophycus canaliculatus]
PATAFHQLDVRFIEKSNYPLALLVVPGTQLTLIINHHATRYSDTVAFRLLASMEYLLHSFVEKPNEAIEKFSLVEPFGLTTCDEVSVDQAVGALRPETRFESVVEWFESQVASNPNRPAVTLGDKTLSYHELNAMVNEIAVRLVQVGVQRNGRVAIACDCCVETIASIFAVLKCGAAYIPVDPGTSESVLADRLRPLDIESIVGDKEMQSLAASLEVPIVSTKRNLPNANPRAETERVCSSLPDASDTAYLIFTSGSTGTAKAVEVSHGALSRSTFARTTFYPTSPESFLLLSPLWFDSSIAGLFWTICSGGKLVVPVDG